MWAWKINFDRQANSCQKPCTARSSKTSKTQLAGKLSLKSPKIRTQNCQEKNTQIETKWFFWVSEWVGGVGLFWVLHLWFQVIYWWLGGGCFCPSGVRLFWVVEYSRVVVLGGGVVLWRPNGGGQWNKEESE